MRRWQGTSGIELHAQREALRRRSPNELGIRMVKQSKWSATASPRETSSSGGSQSKEEVQSIAYF
jgi:hypothetical protein